MNLNLPKPTQANVIMAFLIVLLYFILVAFVPLFGLVTQLFLWVYIVALVLDKYKT